MPSPPRTLLLNIGSEPATLDPALATDPSALQVVRMLFLSLVDTAPTTGAPQHSLATSWAVSADGLVWEFKLRNDARWVRYNPANNRIEVQRAVTADDVVYSVRRVFDPRVNSGFAPIFASLIRGAESLRTADPKKTSDATFEQLFAALGVQAIDETTVRFTLTRPAVYFPSIVSTWLVRTQPREAIEAGGTVWTEPGKIWTNGPYVLERWAHRREIVLRKNEAWYDAELVQIARIRFVMIPDATSALEAYRAGNLDSLDPYGGLTATLLEQARQDPLLNQHLRIVPTLCSHYYGFNTAKPPFNDPLVRKAFTAALDRETLVTSMVRLGEPARWFTRPELYASLDISDTIGIPFNVNQAREYLRQAGYDGRTKRLPIITLGVNSHEVHEQIAETLVQMWKNTLNAEVRVTKLDWKSYLQQLREDAPNIFRLGYCAYYPDAANFGRVFTSKSPDNFTRWSNAAFDQAIDTAARQVDIRQRRALYRTAEKILVEDDAVIIPLWWSVRATLTRPNVERTYAIVDGYERLETWGFK
ncbi:MAG: peptide ABC transporter substrate-binding protein [Anaerolineae bacterium]|nr:peptide ABC transporter substrate-binding protein [Anaerolineae bacterium]